MNNIALGNHAGQWITDECYQFVFTVPTHGNCVEECQTTMTPEEFEVVNTVVRRAIENKRILCIGLGPNAGKDTPDNGVFIGSIPDDLHNHLPDSNVGIEDKAGKDRTVGFRKNYEVSDFDRLPENLNPNGHVKPYRMNDNAVAGVPSHWK